MADAADAPQGVGAARARLADAARGVIDAVAAAGDGDDAVLADAADALDTVATSLRGLASPDAGVRHRTERRSRELLPGSLLVGRANPMSAAGTYSFADGILEVRVRFGTAYEGPPGYVHGGVVALAFDELFGMVTVMSGHRGLTGRLSTRYRAPTPLRQELRCTAWVDHHEGRRTVTRGTIHAGDTLTAQAEGLFVELRADTAREYFGVET